VTIENLIQKIIENVAGLEACLLLDGTGEVIFQRVLKNPDQSIQLTTLLVKTIIKNNVVTYFDRIKFVTLEGADKKLILSYLPKKDMYISIIGTHTLMNGIVQLHLKKLVNTILTD